MHGRLTRIEGQRVYEGAVNASGNRSRGDLTDIFGANYQAAHLRTAQPACVQNDVVIRIAMHASGSRKRQGTGPLKGEES